MTGMSDLLKSFQAKLADAPDDASSSDADASDFDDALVQVKELATDFLTRAGEEPDAVTDLIDDNGDDENAVLTGLIDIIASQPGYAMGEDGKLEGLKEYGESGEEGQLSNVTMGSFTELGATDEQALALHGIYSELRGPDGEGLSISDAWEATIALAIGGDVDPDKAGEAEGMGFVAGGVEGMEKAIMKAIDDLMSSSSGDDADADASDDADASGAAEAT